MAIMNSEGVPVVSLRTRVDGPLSADDNVTPDNPQIDLDHFSGAYEAASYLVNECGHEIVACIRGPATSVSAQAKFEGVRAALGDRLSPRYVISAQTYDYQAGYDRMAELWGWPAKPTALFCYNDELALGALRYCYDNGISVPGHLDIVGYDDIRPARFAYPALSTVRVPRDGLARLAVDIIHLQTYLGRTTPYRLEEQPHLVLRGSVGMPAGRPPRSSSSRSRHALLERECIHRAGVRRAHRAGVLDVARPTAPPAGRRRGPARVVQPHRHADHALALLHQQPRGGGAVDAARERGDHERARHTGPP